MRLLGTLPNCLGLLELALFVIAMQISAYFIPDVIPSEMCYLRWQKTLLALAQLVEPNIPD